MTSAPRRSNKKWRKNSVRRKCGFRTLFLSGLPTIPWVILITTLIILTLGRTMGGLVEANHPPPIRFFLNFSKTNYYLDLPFSVAVHISLYPISQDDHHWWCHRPPADQQTIICSSSCRACHSLSTKSEIFLKYCNILKTQKGGSINHPPCTTVGV